MRVRDQVMGGIIAAFFSNQWFPESIARICNEFPFEFVF